MERTPTPQLAQIADRFGCDKGLRGPSERWGATNYADVYQAYLHDRRNDELNLMEVGIGVAGPNWDAKIAHGRNADGGASLRMWAEYLPNSTIHGVDINDASHLNGDRITTHQVDQGDRAQLESLRATLDDQMFDFIIDDGSHRADHQQLTLEVLFPLLRPGGYYIIEDLNDRGHGGRANGRHATPDTVATRTLLTEFNRSGELPEPNALTDQTFLQHDVDQILFHSPRAVQRATDLAIELVRTLLGRSGSGLLSHGYVTDSHRIVVLRRCLRTNEDRRGP